MSRFLIKPNMMLSAALATAALTLTGCSTISNLTQNEKKAAATAEEKAGRITMVLSEEALVASPELASVSIELPSPELIETWGQAGSSADKVIGHSNAASELTVAWRTNIGEGSGKKSALTAPPVASSTTVYTLDSEQRVVATDLVTGGRVWSKKLKGLTDRDKIGIGGGLAVEGDTLVVASGFGFVAALNAGDGGEKWQRNLGAPMTGSPTIRDGRIFVGSNNNEIFALNFETGETLWSDQAIAETARVLSSPSAAAVEDFVIAPYSSGEVIAYRSSNGRRLWTDAISQSGRFTPISEINDIGSRPVLSGGLVFAASQSGLTVAIDGRSGNRVWAQPIGSTQAPALAGPYMFVSGVDGKLAALKPDTGEAFWVVQLPTYENAEKRKKRISYSGPVIASGRILLIASTGELLAFSPQTGEQVGSVKLGDVTYIEPIVVQDKLIALTDKGRLIAIR